MFCSAVGRLSVEMRRPLLSTATLTRVWQQGLAEQQLSELADANSELLEVYCPRPSGVNPSDAPKSLQVVGLLYNAIGADELAGAFIHLCVSGYSKRIIENSELKTIRWLGAGRAAGRGS